MSRPINRKAALVISRCAFLLGLLCSFSLSLLSFLPSALQAQEQQLRIAAAADLQWALSDLARLYESQVHTKVKVTYGSSGNFSSQIQNGAPFDLFFSADVDYPRKLQPAEPGSLYTYARGRIVLWALAGAKVNVANEEWSALLDSSVQKIAIANPEHAPYGRAAIAALKKAGLYEQVRAKLVYGENIAQAAQFVQSGNAQIGIIAKSLAVSPAMKNGQVWEIPETFHPPIEQAAVVLKKASNKDAAKAFLEFVKSDAGRNILASRGFSVPNAPAAGPEGSPK